MIRRAGIALVSLLAAAFGALLLYEESLRGFPDGHLTDYDRFAQLPSKLIGFSALALAAAGLFFASRRHGRGPAIPVAIVTLLALLVLAALVGIPFFGAGLDHGQGG